MRHDHIICIKVTAVEHFKWFDVGYIIICSPQLLTLGSKSRRKSVLCAGCINTQPHVKSENGELNRSGQRTIATLFILLQHPFLPPNVSSSGEQNTSIPHFNPFDMFDFFVTSTHVWSYCWAYESKKCCPIPSYSLFFLFVQGKSIFPTWLTHHADHHTFFGCRIILFHKYVT